LRWLSAGLSPLFKAVLYYMAMSKSWTAAVVELLVLFHLVAVPRSSSRFNVILLLWFLPSLSLSRIVRLIKRLVTKQERAQETIKQETIRIQEGSGRWYVVVSDIYQTLVFHIYMIFVR
jgi:hypothetical protein